MLISMHISNRFVIECNIEIVVRMFKLHIAVLQVWIPGLFDSITESYLQAPLFTLSKFPHFRKPLSKSFGSLNREVYGYIYLFGRK